MRTAHCLHVEGEPMQTSQGGFQKPRRLRRVFGARHPVDGTRWTLHYLRGMFLSSFHPHRENQRSWRMRDTTRIDQASFLIQKSTKAPHRNDPYTSHSKVSLRSSVFHPESQRSSSAQTITQRPGMALQHILPAHPHLQQL